MALKLKTAVQDLYRKISGVPKSELRSQGEMIRQDWKGKPGSDYRMKSAILNAHNLIGNKFRPKGTKAVHAALDSVAPLIHSTDVGKAAASVVGRVSRGSKVYADVDRINPFSQELRNIERKYGFAYDNEQSFPVDNSTGEPEIGNFVDLIPVRIGEYQFRGAIGSLTDTSSPTWAGTGYAGRPDQVYSYGGVERTISFDLKVYAVSHKHIKNMYQRVNKLYELTRPTPDVPLAPTRMSAPLTRLVIGDYLREQVIMTALTVTPIEELAWEISDPETSYPSNTLSLLHNDGLTVPAGAAAAALNVAKIDQRYIVPRGLNINLGFTVIHDTIPTTAASVFRSKTDSKHKAGY